MMIVKEWFRKNLKPVSGYKPGKRIESIERETEKAVFATVEYFRADGEHEIMVQQWIPKSCICEEEEERKEVEQKLNNGMARWQKLYDFAVANGVKVRKNSKTSTIIAAIREAGLREPA